MSLATELPQAIVDFMRENLDKPAVEYKAFQKALGPRGVSGGLPEERRPEHDEAVEGVLVAKTYAQSRRGGRMIWCHVLAEGDHVAFPVFHSAHGDALYDAVAATPLSSRVRAVFANNSRRNVVCAKFETVGND